MYTHNRLNDVYDMKKHTPFKHKKIQYMYNIYNFYELEIRGLV